MLVVMEAGHIVALKPTTKGAMAVTYEQDVILAHSRAHLTPHAGDLRSAPAVQPSATREGETNSGESPSNRANA